MDVSEFLHLQYTVSLINNLWTLASSSALQNPLCFTIWSLNSSKWGRLRKRTNENVTRTKKHTCSNHSPADSLHQKNFQSLHRLVHQWDPKMEAKWLGLNDLSMKIVIIDTLTIYRILHIMEVTQNLHEWLTIDEL